MATFKHNLENSIFETIVYFDIFDYPLTVVEIWKWLYLPNNQSITRFNLLEIQKILEDSDKIKSLIDSRQGFYFLKGREELVELRQQRYNLAEKKFKKAFRVVRFLKFIPSIKMIAICNDLAWSNAPKDSDIDLFIVTTKNKLWTVRFWAASFLKIFGLRPSPHKTQDKICLSFLVDEENLNLEKISLDQPDIYLIYWIAQLAPIYDRGGVYEKFMKANEWIKKYLPNVFSAEMTERRKCTPLVAQLKDYTSQKSLFENFLKWMQIKVMPLHLKEMANRDTRVVISDAMLKFHVNDRRNEYQKKWEEKIVKLLNC